MLACSHTVSQVSPGVGIPTHQKKPANCSHEARMGQMLRHISPQGSIKCNLTNFKLTLNIKTRKS
uniref:Uncharacterized protein n=1 Tax=Anguilla anguilla TaxID=7936 RepID=A0A0E9VYC3_ANGAN